MTAISSAFKGISGEYEIQRILGALGTVIYIFSAPAFIWAGKITATMDTFCLAYPAGIAACLGATAGSIALKDRHVAQAKVLQSAGADAPSEGKA